MKKVGIFILIIVVTSVLYLRFRSEGVTKITEVVYKCDSSKTISATYYEGLKSPESSPDERPVPTGSVKVSLDGGPVFILHQTISASGVHYSNGDPQILEGQPGAETFVFWNKGKEAIILNDNKMDTSYTNCIE